MLNLNNNFLSKNIIGFLIPAFLISTTLTPMQSVQAQTQDCEKALAEAEQKYSAGRFDEAIDLLEKCLPVGFSDEEKKKAYKLLAFSYLAKDYLDQAKNAILKLLELVPTWQPDPIQDPPPFTKMVEEVKEQMEKEREDRVPTEPEEITLPEVPAKGGGGKKILLVAGGGAVVAALVGFLLTGGSAEAAVRKKLADPPTLPPVP